MLRVLRAPTHRSLPRALCQRFCSSQPPKVEESQGIQIAKFILRNLVIGAAGLSCGYGLSEYFKAKGVPTDPTREKAKSAVTDPDELANVQGAVTERVYFDVTIDGGEPERIVIGLYGADCPITVKNFAELCKGNAAASTSSSRKSPLHYLNSPFHRIIPGFMIQGGDTTDGTGAGGASIYEGAFKDENFKHRHSGLGVLSMANRGKDTNTSQFFITLTETPWLDGRHVVFGQVLFGAGTLRRMEACGSKTGAPSRKISIASCGPLAASPCDTAGGSMPLDGKEDLDETGRRIDRIMK